MMLINCSDNKPRELSEMEMQAIVKQAVKNVVNPVFIYSKTDENSDILMKQKLKSYQSLMAICECANWIGIPLTDNEGKDAVGFIKKTDLTEKSIIILRPKTGELSKCPECK